MYNYDNVAPSSKLWGSQHMQPSDKGVLFLIDHQIALTLEIQDK